MENEGLFVTATIVFCFSRLYSVFPLPSSMFSLSDYLLLGLRKSSRRGKKSSKYLPNSRTLALPFSLHTTNKRKKIVLMFLMMKNNAIYYCILPSNRGSVTCQVSPSVRCAPVALIPAFSFSLCFSVFLMHCFHASPLPSRARPPSTNHFISAPEVSSTVVLHCNVLGYVFSPFPP